MTYQHHQESEPAFPCGLPDALERLAFLTSVARSEIESEEAVSNDLLLELVSMASIALASGDVVAPIRPPPRPLVTTELESPLAGAWRVLRLALAWPRL